MMAAIHACLQYLAHTSLTKRVYAGCLGLCMHLRACMNQQAILAYAGAMATVFAVWCGVNVSLFTPATCSLDCVAL